ncbi:MAG: Crp/Fnr family transcriptional regulator [Oscillospiraceae bacterium]|nr:Crp/Fnr family transcriptional regulator [Oscillospiraceae bacterium]
MQDFIQLVSNTGLFSDIDKTDIPKMAKHLQMKVRSFKKGDFIYRAGEAVSSMAILVQGSLIIQKDCYWGNRSVVRKITAGEAFGESYAMPGSKPLMFDVVALENSTVLFLNMDRLLNDFTDNSEIHTVLLKNLLLLLADRNRLLTQKIDYMSQRSTRDKLIAYLSAQSVSCGSSSFDIPFNRQQLADFLSVDRSAMSAELGRMRDEGMLSFERNHFELHTIDRQ